MQTVQTKNCVMSQEVAMRKMKRMALEVAERNSEEPELVIAGITGNGEVVAKCLVNELKKLANFRITEVKIELNKKDPVDVTFSPSIETENKAIVIVDDVSNTGKTMMYAMKPLLNTHPKKIQTLVLVERSHKLFPVQTDYAGLSITTTLQEHISVETEKGEIRGAWLF